MDLSLTTTSSSSSLSSTVSSSTSTATGSPSSVSTPAARSYDVDNNQYNNVSTTDTSHNVLLPEDEIERWWTIDDSMVLASKSSIPLTGANRLMNRCIRFYGWTMEYTKRVLEGYYQFIILKQLIQDWDDKCISPPIGCPIDEMWQLHICDNSYYQSDCQLLCDGHILHCNNRDYNIGIRKHNHRFYRQRLRRRQCRQLIRRKQLEYKSRIDATKIALTSYFKNNVDLDIWWFGKNRVMQNNSYYNHRGRNVRYNTTRNNTSELWWFYDGSDSQKLFDDNNHCETYSSRQDPDPCNNNDVDDSSISASSGSSDDDHPAKYQLEAIIEEPNESSDDDSEEDDKPCLNAIVEEQNESNDDDSDDDDKPYTGRHMLAPLSPALLPSPPRRRYVTYQSTPPTITYFDEKASPGSLFSPPPTPSPPTPSPQPSRRPTHPPIVTPSPITYYQQKESSPELPSDSEPLPLPSPPPPPQTRTAEHGWKRWFKRKIRSHGN